MSLAVVRSIGTARGWRSEEDAADFEQEIIDQYALAMAAATLTSRTHEQRSSSSVRT